MSYHAIGNAWGSDEDEFFAAAAAEAAKSQEGECDRSGYRGDEWCDLLAKKNTEFIAAAAQGVTPAQWYEKQGVTPSGKPLKPKLFGINKDVIMYGALFGGIVFLATRKK